MFTDKNSSDEIMSSMNESLESKEARRSAVYDALDKFAKAADYLDSIGEHQKADEILSYFKVLASSDSSDLLKAFEETGTPFRRSDYKADDNCADNEDLEVDPEDLDSLEKLFEE